MNELSLFTGCGGGLLGSHLLGWRTVCAVEQDDFRCARIVDRQNEGFLSPFPIYCGDITGFDARPWRGCADVVSGGFPCQDISGANPKAEGITGARSGLWKEMLRVVREVGPRFVFVENSPMLTGRGLGVVLGDLAALGYDARWGVLGADDLGGFHRRERLFIVANSSERRRDEPRQGQVELAGRTQAQRGGDIVANANPTRLEGLARHGRGNGGSDEAGYSAAAGVCVLADAHRKPQRGGLCQSRPAEIGGPDLATAITLWPTPTVHGNTNFKGASQTSGNGLGTEVMNAFGPEPSSSNAATAKSGPLNPEFAEWLMGWPRGWTASVPLATGRFLSWSPQHGGF